MTAGQREVAGRWGDRARVRNQVAPGRGLLAAVPGEVAGRRGQVRVEGHEPARVRCRVAPGRAQAGREKNLQIWCCIGRKSAHFSRIPTEKTASIYLWLLDSIKILRP